jgi:hypothetical protein
MYGHCSTGIVPDYMSLMFVRDVEISLLWAVLLRTQTRRQ